MSLRKAGDTEVLRLLAADKARLYMHGELTDEDLGEIGGVTDWIDQDAYDEALSDPRYPIWNEHPEDYEEGVKSRLMALARQYPATPLISLLELAL